MINPVQYGLCLSRLVGRSRLREVDLSEADLEGADLRFANLRFSNLRGADLEGANLCEADLRGTDLYGTDLRGADLRGATKWGRKASTLSCALAKVGAPWECIGWEWCDRGWPKPREYDHWSGLAKLYMLGQEDD